MIPTDAPPMPGAAEPAPDRDGLYVASEAPALRIVLHEPRIPPNVGAVSRLCAALGVPLCLTGAIAFREDHPARRRAGLDYWDRVERLREPSLEALRARFPAARFYLFSTKAERSLYEARFAPGDALVFGSETDGLPAAILRDHRADGLRIPMVRGVRSLNLANAVAVAAFEAMRQLRAW